MLMLSLSYVLLVVFFLMKSYSVLISLILIELMSFVMILLFALVGLTGFNFVFLLLFSLFVLLAVTGVIVYFSYVMFVGRDYLLISSCHF